MVAHFQKQERVLLNGDNMSKQYTIFDYIDGKNTLHIYPVENEVEEQQKTVIGYCHATNETCNIEYRREVAREIGCKCIARCCQSCTEVCGARCNYSAHQPKVCKEYKDFNNQEWVDNPNYYNPLEDLANHGTGFVDGRKRVLKFFKEKHSSSEKEKFLKEEYGIGGFGFFTEKPNVVHQSMSDSKGIKYEYNDSSGTLKKEFCTWKKLANTISSMIERNIYTGGE